MDVTVYLEYDGFGRMFPEFQSFVADKPDWSDAIDFLRTASKSFER